MQIIEWFYHHQFDKIVFSGQVDILGGRIVKTFPMELKLPLSLSSWYNIPNMVDFRIQKVSLWTFDQIEEKVKI